MASSKQAAIKCAEECVKLANQRFHLTQEIERLNAQVAMLMDTLHRADRSLSAFIGDEGWTQGDLDNADATTAALCSDKNGHVAVNWLAAHDKQVRNAALEEAAVVFETTHCTLLPSGFEVAEAVREMKGKL